MRECCHEYENALLVLREFRKAALPAMIPYIDAVIRFVQEDWDAHVDRAGESAWADA